MPIFTAGAGIIAGAIGFTAGSTGFLIAQSLIAAGLAAGTGHLLGVFDEPGGLPQVEDPGVEQRLAASTQNRVPVLYGEFMQRGSVTYFEVSEDRKTLYTVITIGEGPISTIDRVYWDDISVSLDAAGEVIDGVDVEGNVITRLNGQVNIQLYGGNVGSNNSTYLEGLSADWTSAHKMTNLVYAVVTVRYNRENDVTGLSDMRFVGTAPIIDPSDAVLDQLTNTRYGLGLPTSAIDTTSFAAAKSYFSANLPYTDSSGNTQTAPRFQINGSINTSDPVFERIEAILLGSNSSLRWQNGKYSIFSNKADTVEEFTMTESRVIGDIQVSEVGLNSVVNQVEVRYGRNAANNYQRNTLTVTLPEANMYPNELRRVRTVDLPLVRTFTEAERLAYILMNQSREQLSVRHNATVECMALEAGDVIGYTLPNYGWNEKLFRITRVSEIENENGLQYEIEAVEYSADVYTDRNHVEPGASPNTNLPALDNILGVTDLAITNQSADAGVPSFTLTWTVPDNVLVEEFDIYVNNVQGMFSSNLTTLLRSVRPSGPSFISGDIVSEVITGLPGGSYHIWVVGRNEFASSPESNTAVLTNWNPQADTGLIAIRLHQNTALDDPGAPTGAEGLGGDWYDPTGEYGTVPDDPDPHWEARGLGIPTGGSTREKTFTLTGAAASFSENVVLSNKETHFDFSGTPGMRALASPAAAWNANFAVAGMPQGIGSDLPAEAWVKQFSFSGNPVSNGPRTGVFGAQLSGTPADTIVTSDGTDRAQFVFDYYDAGTPAVDSSYDLDNMIAVFFQQEAAYFNGMWGVRHMIPAIGFDETFTFDAANTRDDDNNYLLPALMQTWYEQFSVITDRYTFSIENTNPSQFITALDTLVLTPIVPNDELSIDHFVGIISPFGIVEDNAGPLDFEPNTAVSQPRLTGRVNQINDISLDGAEATHPTKFRALMRRGPTDTNGSTALTTRLVAGFNTMYSGIMTCTINDSSTENLTVDNVTSVETRISLSDTDNPHTITINGVVTAPDVTAGRDIYNVFPGDTVRITGFNISDGAAAFFADSNVTPYVDSADAGRFLQINVTTVDQANSILEFTTNRRGRFVARSNTGDDRFIPFSNWSKLQMLIQADAVDKNYFPLEPEDAYGSSFFLVISSFLDSINLESVISGHGAVNTSTGIPTHWWISTASSPGTPDTFQPARNEDVLVFGIATPDMTAADVAQDMANRLDALGITGLTATVTGSNLAIEIEPGATGGPYAFGTRDYIRLEIVAGESRTGRAEATLSGTLTTTQEVDEGTEGSINTSASVTVDGIELNEVVASSTNLGTFIDSVRAIFDSSPLYSTTLDNNVITVTAATAELDNEPDITFVSGESTANPSGTTLTNTLVTTGRNARVAGDDTEISLRVDNVEFDRLNVADLSISEIATAISTAFDGRVDYTSTATGSTANVQRTTTGPTGEPTVIITNVGVDPDDASVTGTLVITRTVVTTGADEAFNGTDATVSLRIDNNQFSSIDAAGMTLAQIRGVVNTSFGNRPEFTSAIVGGSVEVTNEDTGTENSPSVVIFAGADPDGTASDFAVATTIVSTGSSSTVSNGSPSSYLIEAGTESTTAQLGSALNNDEVATQLAIAINTHFSQYVASFAGNVVTATSTFEGSTPDLVVTITPGTNIDSTTGTLSSAEAIVREGQAVGIDLTNTEWEYYVVNQEVRVDDDTTMMLGNNVIGVRRGLILDADAFDGSSGPFGSFDDDNLALISNSFVLPVQRHNLIVTGAAWFKVTEFNTSSTTYAGLYVRSNVEFELLDADSNTWVRIGTSPAELIGFDGNPDAGQRFRLSIAYADVTVFIARDETLPVSIRFKRNWFTTTDSAGQLGYNEITQPTQANAGNFGFNTLLLQELLPQT